MWPACPTVGRPESISPGSAQHAARGKGPYVFPGGRPRQPLSVMAMTMAMPRLGAGDFTVHGMRSAARSWMADNDFEFELAEACLAHVVGNREFGE